MISPPWAVSLPAQIAAVYAIGDEEYYEKKYLETHLLRNEFIDNLKEIENIELLNTVTNFILVNLDPLGPKANEVVTSCREHGLFIRDVSNMGNCFGSHTVRIAVKNRETNEKMLGILRKVLIAQGELVI